MSIPQNILDILAKRERQEPLTSGELMQLRQWCVTGMDNNDLFDEKDWESVVLEYVAFLSDQSGRDRALQRFMLAADFADQSLLVPAPAEVPENGAVIEIPPARRVPVLQKWSWVAAAVIVIGTAIAVMFFSGGGGKRHADPGIRTASEILPGTNRATLTIGNEQPINLSDHKSGIAVGNSIHYNDGERIADAESMLVLTTPRGGQYQAVLPDGTKVWLNAASSVRFPSKFRGDKREVEISGEVYMEVAQNKQAAFTVKSGDVVIQVLGTSFNINAYPDEEGQKTTLVSGSVKVVSAGRSGPSGQTAILRPGEAAIVAGAGIRVQQANVEQDLAWKNGYFSFEGMEIREMAKQLERWYDIQVRFSAGFRDMKIDGQMDRNVKLSEIVQLFNDYGFNASLEGQTLTLSNK